jgi:hypothetical protein
VDKVLEILLSLELVAEVVEHHKQVMLVVSLPLQNH